MSQTFERRFKTKDNLVSCNLEGRQKAYGRVYLPAWLVSKYNLEGVIEIIEDEKNCQLVLRKHKHKAEALD